MKSMKILGVIILIFGLFFSTNGMAQNHPQRPKHKPMRPAKSMKVYTKNDYKIISRNMINKNVPILKKAQAALEIGKNYNGDFSRAIRHQKYARHLHKKGMYKKSAYHARAARKFAVSSMRANKGEVQNEMNNSKEEDEATSDSPTEEELDKELPKEEMTEEELMNLQLEELGLE